jgi:ParB-like chromosome segregation protein Spo0J
MVTQAPPRHDRRDADIELWLDLAGIGWTFEPKLPLSAIDRAASLANQARLEPLDESVVDRYAADYERGDLFPPVLVWRRSASSGLLVLIGGNHRITGAERAKLRAHPAYLLDVADDAQALRLAYADNRRHGLPPSDDERVAQGMHLIAAAGLSQVEAAAVVGLSLGKLHRGVGTARADGRARALDVEGWSKLSKSARWRLSALSSDPVFEAAARLAAATEMGAEAVYSLVRQVMAVDDDTAAMLVIGEAEESQGERRRSRGGKALKATPRSRMLEALRVVGSLDAGAVVAGCTTDDHRKVLRDTIMSAAQTMAKVEGQLR